MCIGIYFSVYRGSCLILNRRRLAGIKGCYNSGNKVEVPQKPCRS